MMGSDTSHTAIKAIGGLNLPGGGGGAAPFQKPLREVKFLSYVNEAKRIIRTVVRNPTKFCKETKGPLQKPSHSKGEFRTLKADLIIAWGTSFSIVLPMGRFAFYTPSLAVVSSYPIGGSIGCWFRTFFLRWFRLLLSFVPFSCWFWSFLLAVVSPYSSFDSPQCWFGKLF